MNSISISGNLGKDCEKRSLADGTSVYSFSVADSQGKEKPSIWWNCALWGKRGDALAQYLLKGQPVTVIGSVSEREFSDKDGNKRKSIDVRVSDIALQGGRRDESKPVTKYEAKPVKPLTTGGGFDDMDDDIPF